MILAAITTHKRRPEMVERALKSVVAQTYQDWNLVVVDDSPADYEYRDDVRKMVEGWAEKDSRICYVQHDRNYGVSHARNTALEIARNTQDGGGYEFIAYLDDDDEWLPTKLEKQLAMFQGKSKKLALVYCGNYLINDDTGKITISIYKDKHNSSGDMFTELVRTNFISVATLLRSEAVMEAGGFDEFLEALEDWDLWLRMSERYDFAYVNEPLLNVHISEHGRMRISNDIKTNMLAYEQIYQKNRHRLNENKNCHILALKNLLSKYGANRKYKDVFRTWFQLVVLNPSDVLGNIWQLAKAFVPYTLKLTVRKYIHN